MDIFERLLSLKASDPKERPWRRRLARKSGSRNCFNAARKELVGRSHHERPARCNEVRTRTAFTPVAGERHPTRCDGRCRAIGQSLGRIRDRKSARGLESFVQVGGTEASNPCILQSGYQPVGIIDWSTGPARLELPENPRVLSTWSGPAPRQVGRDGSPVGGCASSASTGIDARCGGPGVSDARGGLSMVEEIEWFVGIDWASQSHQVCLVDAHGECLGERALRMAARGSRSCAIG